MPEYSQLVTLRDGTAAVSIAPNIGGSIARYWSESADGGVVEWLRPASAQALTDGDVLGMSSFPLVPFSSRIRDGRFTFREQHIALPLNFLPERHTIHGHGWQAPWTVSEQTVNRLRITYDHAADAWPFPYHAEQDFHLSGNVLEQRLSVRNVGDRPMPLGLGMHPYFVRTPRATVTATVAEIWHNDAEYMPTERTPPPPEKQLANGVNAEATYLDNVYTGWQRLATVTWPEWGASLAIRADPPMDMLVVYTPTGEDYLCVEPASNITDAFNYAAAGAADTGMIVLGPGEQQSCRASFTPSRDG